MVVTISRGCIVSHYFMSSPMTALSHQYRAIVDGHVYLLVCLAVGMFTCSIWELYDFSLIFHQLAVDG